MLKILLLFIAVMLSGISVSSIYAMKVARLDRLYKSPNIVVTDNYLYIYDLKNLNIDIYSIPGYRFISTFGRRGEGSGDFKFITIFMTFPGSIYICSPDKISYYSKEGKLLKERRTLAYSGSYVPIGDRFAYETARFDKERNVTQVFVLADSDFQKEKEFYQTHLNVRDVFIPPKRKTSLIADTVKLIVYKDKMYLGDTTKGFYFIIFDKRGNKINEINIHCRKEPITGTEKQSYVDRFVAWHGKEILQRVDCQFPDYFPAYVDFKVADDRIYVFSHVQNPIKEKRQEVTILSLDGKLIKKSSVTYCPAISFDIQKSKYYYLMDNEETENWELFMEDIR